MLPPLVVLVAFVVQSPEFQERPAYLFQAIDKPGNRYRPQAGDILLFDDHSPVTARIYNIFGTAGPLHAGIVFQKPDGKMAILEAGTNAVMKVFVFDLDTRMHDFDGTILVRQLRKRLGEE